MGTIFPNIESFYGDSRAEFLVKLKSVKYLQRDNTQRLEYYVTCIQNALASKNYFSDSNLMSPSYFNKSIQRILVGLGILSYTDLSYFCAQLTDGERRYFFSTTMKLVSHVQRNKLWNNLLNILEDKIFSNRDNAVSFDWYFLTGVSQNERRSFLSWGIFTVKDILFLDIPYSLMTEYFLQVFNNNIKAMLFFLSDFYRLVGPSTDSASLLNIIIQRPSQNLFTILLSFNYDTYLENISSYILPTELIGGSNFVIQRVALGSVSRILNVQVLLKPFLVLDSNLMSPSYLKTVMSHLL